MVRAVDGGGWDCLLLDGLSGGDIASRRLQDRRRCHSEAALAHWVDQCRPGRRLLMLPSAATICRVFRFPGLPSEQVDQALRLQAESHLLGGVPPHRTAVVRVPLAESGEAAGLLLAWPEQSSTRMPSDGGEGWTAVPEIAALLEAWRGDPSSRPLVWADPSDGSIGVVAGGSGGPMIRATCEAAEADEPWDRVVRRVVGETVIASGGSAETAERIVGEAETSLIDLGSIRCSDASSLSDLAGLEGGDAIGALLDAAARASVGPIAAAAALTAKPPSIRRTGAAATFERAFASLSDPKLAIRVVVVAAIMALSMPLVAAGLRTAILRSKLPDPTGFEAAMRTSEQQLAVYRELEAQAWPMMKILGDLSNCMPEAIEVESIGLGHGEPVVVRGFAKPDGDATGADAVLAMERRLRGTRIFDKITKSWDPPDARGIYEFSLSAEVARPTASARIDEAEDFAVNTLAVRRYGPLASTGEGSGDAAASAPPSTPATSDRPTSTPEDESSVATAEDEPDSSTAGGGTPARGIGRRGSVASGGADPGGRGVAVPSSSPPAETVSYTDTEIAAMSKAEAQSALGRVARARQSASLDDAAKERLRDLFDKLLQRVREAE